jgi:23S rRNA (cytidine1920-2'-O)/16S rRNA (cytidine1409-2'-O)-methyltransferase
MTGKHRLDQLLTLRGLAPTRSRARDLIKRGVVTVAGEVETRAGLDVASDADIAVAEAWSGYVSRGALKLEAALDQFGFGCEGRIALDIGASTGGFTQVLLRRGAARVYAVDVGRGQLHPDVAADARVRNLQNTDARMLGRRFVGEPVDAITADVSFISLTKALPAALSLAAPGAWAVALIKPQFEAGRDHVGKGGVVRDETVRARVVEQIGEFFSAQLGWQVAGTMPSPITGQSGNAEYLIGARYEP